MLEWGDICFAVGGHGMSRPWWRWGTRCSREAQSEAWFEEASVTVVQQPSGYPVSGWRTLLKLPLSSGSPIPPREVAVLLCLHTSMAPRHPRDRPSFWVSLRSPSKWDVFSWLPCDLRRPLMGRREDAHSCSPSAGSANSWLFSSAGAK